MNSNKGIAIALAAVGAVLALSLLVRFVVLSQYGVSGGWMYLALPFGGIGVVVLLLRLGLLNRGQWSGGSIQPSQYNQFNSGAHTPPPAPSQPATSASQRLQELENMRAGGAISDAEYTAKRQQIISSI
jgi:hypothetical protein